jgi:hypothetical protein
MPISNNTTKNAQKQQHGEELPFLQQKNTQAQEHKCEEQKTNAQIETLTCAMLIKLPPYMNDKP